MIEGWGHGQAGEEGGLELSLQRVPRDGLDIQY